MLARTKQFLKNLHQDTSGAMAVEKILLLALIALPIVIILITFRGTITGWFNDRTSQINP